MQNSEDELNDLIKTSRVIEIKLVLGVMTLTLLIESLVLWILK